ncbi:MAG: tetratricopeptide repeat protein, partial [Gammaproteobacteria bacterium]
HFLMGQFDDAIDLMRRVLTRNPDHLIANLILGSALVEIGDVESAKHCANEMMRISPNYKLDVAIERMPYKNTAHVERHAVNLRRAGLD